MAIALYVINHLWIFIMLLFLLDVILILRNEGINLLSAKLKDYPHLSPFNKRFKRLSKSNRVNFLMAVIPLIISFIFFFFGEIYSYDYSKITTDELNKTVEIFKEEIDFDNINHVYLIDETGSTKEPAALKSNYANVIEGLNGELLSEKKNVVISKTSGLELKRYLVAYLLEHLHRKKIKGRYFVGKMGVDIKSYDNEGVVDISPTRMHKTVTAINNNSTNGEMTEFKSVFTDLKKKIIKNDTSGYWIINIFSDFYNDKWVSYEIQSTLNDLCQNQKRRIEFNLIMLPTHKLYANNDKINKLLELIQNSACDCGYVTYDIPLMVHQHSIKTDSSFLRLQLESLNIPTINVKEYGRYNELFFKYNDKKRKYGIIANTKENAGNSLIYFAATHSETDKRALIECNVSSQNRSIHPVNKRLPVNEFIAFLLGPKQEIELKIVRGKIEDEETGVIFYQQKQDYKFFIPIEQDYNN